MDMNIPNEQLSEPKGDVLEICSKPGSHTGLLGGGVDGDEDQVRLANGFVNVGREEEVAAAGLPNDVLEPGFVDGELKVRAIPRINTSLIEVDNRDLDVRALERDYGARRATFGMVRIRTL